MRDPSPYRDPAPRGSARHDGRPAQDRELVPALSVLWIASVARLAAAIARHETFTGPATLALLAVIGIPWMLAAARRSR